MRQNDLVLPQFLLISLVARIPSVISSAICGQMLGDKDYVTAGIVYAITGAVSLLGYYLYNRIVKRRKSRNND